MAGLPVGRARYGLMLNELGVIIDDGVTLRLAEDRFLVGTSSAGAERIALWLDEWRQCEWPERQLLIAPLTTSTAVVTVSGPKARAALQAAGTDIDLAADAFPHMTFREGHVAGVPARVVAASFSGERSYEVNVPAGCAEPVWRAIAAASPEAVPVGVEAWLLLRLEKGYMHVGVDTDGTTTPDDVGFDAVARRKGWFVGKRSLSRPENLRADRHQLVGLEAPDGRPLAPGAHLVRPGGRASEGYITSAGLSPTLGGPVAMAMVKGGRARLGETLELVGEGGRQVRIAARTVYDPEGARLDG
jgi:sarcosine oxidase subunit alpha